MYAVPACEIEVAPAQPAHLAAPGSGGHEDPQQGTEVEVLLVGGQKKGAGVGDGGGRSRGDAALGDDALAAGFVGSQPQRTAWPSAPRTTAWTWRIVAGTAHVVCEDGVVRVEPLRR